MSFVKYCCTAVPRKLATLNLNLNRRRTSPLTHSVCKHGSVKKVADQFQNFENHKAGKCLSKLNQGIEGVLYHIILMK
jgi:hypothetical protein